MTKILSFIIALLLIMAVAVPTFARSKKKNTSEQQKSFVVKNRNHTQVLARKSIRAHKGLENAARHSHAIVVDDPKDDPKDDSDSGTVVDNDDSLPDKTGTK